jgi:hypothetical protein
MIAGGIGGSDSGRGSGVPAGFPPGMLHADRISRMTIPLRHSMECFFIAASSHIHTASTISTDEQGDWDVPHHYIAKPGRL